MAYLRIHGAASPGTDFTVPSGGARILSVTGTPTVTIDGSAHTVAADYCLEPKEEINVQGASTILHLELV